MAAKKYQLVVQRYRSLSRNVGYLSRWENILCGPPNEAVALLAARYFQHKSRMFVGMRGANAAEFSMAEMGYLKSIADDLKVLEKTQQIAEDAARVIAKELAEAEATVQQILRRRPRGMTLAEFDKIISTSTSRNIASMTKKGAGSLTARIVELLPEASRAIDPYLHSTINKAFLAGPLGAQAWERIAAAIQLGAIKMREGKYSIRVIERDVIRDFGELLAASHPGYRQVIEQKTKQIVDLGLEPFEVFGTSWLTTTTKKGKRMLTMFRDGLLLGVSKASGAGTIGEAGIVVTLENRQAKELLEVETNVERMKILDQLKKTRRASKAQAAANQQVDTLRREGIAISAGSILYTADGKAFVLNPVPETLRVNILSRPYILPSKESEWLGMTLRERGEAGGLHGRGKFLQIRTPFSTEQIGKHSGQLVRMVLGSL